MDVERAVVGVVGLGVMGRAVALRLLGAGRRTLVHSRTRTREGVEAVLAAGGEWRAGPGDVARESDVVLTLLGLPEEVADVYAGPEGLLEGARPGTYLLDLSTSRPELARQIWQRARDAGLHALDAPVSGGETGAREGRLSMMIGGEEADLEAVRPLLQQLADTIVWQGAAGAGQTAKLCNQIAVAANMLGACEALAFARASGLDPARVLQSLQAGSASSGALERYGARMLRRDFQAGFRVSHLVKDLGLALTAAEELELDLPGLELTRMMYEETAEMGLADEGIQALFAAWDDEADDDAGPLVQLKR